MHLEMFDPVELSIEFHNLFKSVHVFNFSENISISTRALAIEATCERDGLPPFSMKLQITQNCFHMAHLMFVPMKMTAFWRCVMQGREEKQ